MSANNPLDIQIAGGHYKDLVIQPIEYIHANGIPFAEGCVIKYVTRWRAKGGIPDLEKARHFIDLLIELESRGRKDVSASAQEQMHFEFTIPQEELDRVQAEFEKLQKERLDRHRVWGTCQDLVQKDAA